MDTLRKPFQGVCNIVRFNWHFYVIATIVILLLILISTQVAAWLQVYLYAFCALTLLGSLLSLAVSCYVYDLTGLYDLAWLPNIKVGGLILNINAGFDETSALLQQKYPQSKLIALDFYDPTLHREVSISRARKAYPPYPNTIQIKTSTLPYADASVENIMLILAAHEVRDEGERIQFFKEMKRILHDNGQIIVCEHLRDLPNFLAYNIGFFHFHSSKTWYHTFKNSALYTTRSYKINPFITCYILQKNAPNS